MTATLTPARTALRLLVIGGDEDTGLLVKGSVAATNPGSRVDCVDTYAEGYAALTTVAYDAVLLDNDLGVRTGLDLLAAVRELANVPPIVLLSRDGDRALDLAAIEAGAADYLDRGSFGPVLLERTIRHALERQAATAELLGSEARYRALFQRAGDAVFIADDDGRFVDANPAACALLGLPRDQVVGRGLADFVEGTDEIADVTEAWAAFLAAGEMRGTVRLRRADGTVRAAEFVAIANFTPGRHLSVLRDDAERIAATDAMRAAVAALQLSEARFRSTLDGVGLYAAILDPAGTLLFVNRHGLERTGWTERDLLGIDAFSLLAPDDNPDERRAAYRAGVEAGSVVAPRENRWRTKSGGYVRIAWTNSPICDDAGRVVAVAFVGEDVTARRLSERTQAQLVAAIEQTAETIVVTDAAGLISFANPAFERSSGIPVADVIGRDAREVFRGSEPWDTSPIVSSLARGSPSTGEWRLSRADGSSYREEVTASPVRDAAGTIVGFVRVGRDVSDVHSLQASLDDVRRDRASFARALAQLDQRGTPEETAQGITDAVVDVPGIDVALILGFEEAGAVRVLAVTGPEGHPFQAGATVLPHSAEYLRGRAALGAWTERRDRDDFDEAFMPTWDALGLRSVSGAPIAEGSQPIGLILLGTTTDDGRDAEAHHAAAIGFAAAAGSLLAGPLALQRSLRASRRRIDAIIAGTEFDPVFQPIVDMVTGIAVGFEGLTRFRDGTRPDIAFADARASGVGIGHETATLERMIIASQGLPTGRWVALNVSAALVLEPDVLSRILSRRTRPIVLEITEHEVIADYAAVRSAVALLGPDVRIAVDDAGAGAANFSHIVELRPDFVKVDMGLVRGVNRDLTRQALIVGLRYFTQATNGFVIAEGVETEEERQTLLGLDLMLGQGYLFGRPVPVATGAPPSGPRAAADVTHLSLPQPMAEDPEPEPSPGA